MTTAEKIAEMFHDGQVYETDTGKNLNDVCLEHGADISRKKHMTRYLFPDKSAIVDFGEFWDIEGNVPFSAEGADETILMNPNTGTVQTEPDWMDDFKSMTPEQWGGDAFENAGLVEVKKDSEGNWVEV